MSLKQVVRRALQTVGLEIYGARGGVYLFPAPRAGRAGQPRSIPTPCHVLIRGVHAASRGCVEVTGESGAGSSFESSVVRLPMFPDACVDDIRLSEVYEFLFRHERLSAIREWRRILRPGGTLAIRGLPDFEAIAAAYVDGEHAGAKLGLDQVFRCTHGDPATASGPDHLRKDVFTRESVSGELATAGYDIVSIERVGQGPGTAALWLDIQARRGR